MTSTSLCSSDIAAFAPCRWWKETNMDGFPVRHITGAVTASQTYAFKVWISAWLHQLHPQAARHRPPCCVGWNHSYLTQENVFGCPWWRAVRDGGRQAEGGVDVGEGIKQWKEGRAGLQGPQAFVFLSHLWRGGNGGEAQEQSAAWGLAGLWQGFRNQRCNITRSYLHSSLLGLCGQG